MKNSKNTAYDYRPFLIPLGLVFLWQAAVSLEWVPAFMLPSPSVVITALIEDLPLLFQHSVITLYEAMIGLSIALVLGFLLAFAMDMRIFIYKVLWPILVISQTIPVIAIAPLLVLWFGYGIAPKVILIVLVCFFPIAIGFFDGFRGTSPDAVRLMRSMGASNIQIFKHLKIPSALCTFFPGFKIALSYSIIGAVIAEWLGGSGGLGVYMLRVRKAYAFDKMFAVILIVSVLSVVLTMLAAGLEKASQPYKYQNQSKKS